MTSEELLNLPEDQLEAMLRGEEPVTEAGEVPAAEVPTVETPPTDAQQGVTVPQPELGVQDASQNRGDLSVALRQERERRQAVEAQFQQVQAALSDPAYLRQVLAQHEPQQMPELMMEDPEVLQAYIGQATAPLVAQIQQLQAERQQERAQMQMQMLKQQFPDIDQSIAEFDATAPNMAGVDPVLKHLAVMGGRALDPNYQQQMIQQQAQALAEKMLAEKLAGNGKQTPVTLSGVTPTMGNADPVEPASFDQWKNLSPEQEAKLLGG